MDGSRYFVFECSRYVVVRGVTDGVGEFARPAVSAGRTHSALQGAAGAGTPQCGLSSRKMTLITSDYGTMCYLRIKWP